MVGCGFLKASRKKQPKVLIKGKGLLALRIRASMSEMGLTPKWSPANESGLGLLCRRYRVLGQVCFWLLGVAIVAIRALGRL